MYMNSYDENKGKSVKPLLLGSIIITSLDMTVFFWNTLSKMLDEKSSNEID